MLRLDTPSAPVIVTGPKGDTGPQGPQGATGATGPACLGYSPQQIALLKWYDVQQSEAVTVGVNPVAIAFDGANVWVANFGNNNVSKLSASDGTTLGTYTVGKYP